MRVQYHKEIGCYSALQGVHVGTGDTFIEAIINCIKRLNIVIECE